MALTTAQRNRLPRSAFVYSGGKNTPRSQWKYPMPTKAQAQKAGISETQRMQIHAAAKSYSSRSTTMGSRSTINKVAKARR
jgi:hypothetical protein